MQEAVSLESAVSQVMGARQRGETIAFILLELDQHDSIKMKRNRMVEAALKVVADCARRRLGQSGAIAGIHPGRLLVAVSALPLEAALILADGVRHDVACQPWLDPWQQLTVSGGVVLFPAHGRRASTLARSLIVMLLRAQSTGGNRVVGMRESKTVIKAAHYPVDMVLKLRELSVKLQKPESTLLREALRKLLAEYEHPDQDASSSSRRR